MSDKKPPTQYATLKPIKLFKEDLGQSDDMRLDALALTERQVQLIENKEKFEQQLDQLGYIRIKSLDDAVANLEKVAEYASLTNALKNINAEIKDNQARLDKLEGYLHESDNLQSIMVRTKRYANPIAVQDDELLDIATGEVVKDSKKDSEGGDL